MLISFIFSVTDHIHASTISVAIQKLDVSLNKNTATTDILDSVSGTHGVLDRGPNTDEYKIMLRALKHIIDSVMSETEIQNYFISKKKPMTSPAQNHAILVCGAILEGRRHKNIKNALSSIFEQHILTDRLLQKITKISADINGLKSPDINPIENVDVLIKYLQAPQIDPVVLGMANHGHSRYQNLPTLQSKATPYPHPQFDSAPPKYQYDWLKTLLGADANIPVADFENAVIREFQQHATPPKPYNLGSINKAYQSITSGKIHQKTAPSPVFTVVMGLGVSGLHKLPLGQNCILQVASQFNYLEAMSARIVPVYTYVDDWTQGPLASLEAAASAIHRRAAMENGTLNHALHTFVTEPNQRYYAHGYLMLKNLFNPEKETFLAKITNHRDELEILPTWVRCESSGAYQLQVFTAAPSFQGQSMPSPTSLEGQISIALVAAQYEAIAKLAVIQSLSQGGRSVPLHLTMVGQGAFNNPPEAMGEAFARVADAVKGFNVRVYIHVFSDIAKDKFVKGLKPEGQHNFSLTTIDKIAFASIPG